MPRKMVLLGAGIGAGASDRGCGRGPAFLRDSVYFNQQVGLPFAELLGIANVITRDQRSAAISEFHQQLSSSILRHLQVRSQVLALLGGDHSTAIATWPALAKVHGGSLADVGLLWVDAHLDAHTPQTSLSGTLHGMPVACLLGRGEFAAQPSLDAKNLVIVGARSYEAGEYELLQQLQVRIYFIEEIHDRGLFTCLQEALSIVRRAKLGYGISWDLDAFDPEDVPGVGSRTAKGISLTEAMQFLQHHPWLQDEQFLAIEIAEFNPLRDWQDKTLAVVANMLRLIKNSEC